MCGRRNTMPRQNEMLEPFEGIPLICLSRTFQSWQSTRDATSGTCLKRRVSSRGSRRYWKSWHLFMNKRLTPAGRMKKSLWLIFPVIQWHIHWLRFTFLPKGSCSQADVPNLFGLLWYRLSVIHWLDCSFLEESEQQSSETRTRMCFVGIDADRRQASNKEVLESRRGWWKYSFLELNVKGFKVFQRHPEPFKSFPFFIPTKTCTAGRDRRFS